MRIFHLVDTSDYNSILVDIAKNTDQSKITLFAGSLSPVGRLHEDLSSLGIETFALGCVSKRHYASAVIRLARLLRRRKIEVLHAHLAQSSLLGLIAGRLARVPACVMTRHHSDAALLSGSRVAVAIDGFTGRYLAEEVIAVSKAVKRALIEIDGVSESKVTVVPNGFDWDRIRPSPEAREAIRKEFGLGNSPVLCAVGRLDRLKGHDVLLRAFADANLHEAARLVIVGQGPQRAKLEEMAQSLGIAKRCVFTGYRADVYNLMVASDVVVHPSFSEAHSSVIVEALSLERPVIATAVGAATEAVIPEATGWLVPPRDPASLAQSMRDALAKPERARLYARAGRDLVRSIYPIQNMLKDYEAIYKRRLHKS